MNTLPTLRRIILIAAFLTTTGGVFAQTVESKYQLKKARVALINGKIYRGILYNITSDSLVIEDKTLAPPGTVVYIRRRHADKAVKAMVKEVTETDLIVNRVEDNTLMKIPRAEIDALRIAESSLSQSELKNYQKVRLHYSAVKYVALYKKGAPTIGAAAGAAFVYLFFKITARNAVPVDIASAAGIVGVSVGLLVGSHKKKMMIDGDAEKFKAMRDKVLAVAK